MVAWTALKRSGSRMVGFRGFHLRDRLNIDVFAVPELTDVDGIREDSDNDLWMPLVEPSLGRDATQCQEAGNATGAITLKSKFVDFDDNAGLYWIDSQLPSGIRADWNPVIP
jgi:hypothetical protein